MLIIFWISVILLIYTYIGYPLILYIIRRFITNKHFIDNSFSPMVTLIIPAYNEEKDIEDKIINSLRLNYPKDKLEIIVSSDASTDKTSEIASRYIDKGIKIINFIHRTGKMGVLNKTVPKSRGEIIVFTDANAMFDKNAIKNLVRHFVDKEVGCVCGEKNIKITKEHLTTDTGESLYWRFESFLKEIESAIYSCSGADGSIYAIRKELYPFPKDDIIIMDDMVISLTIIEKGNRCIYEPEAKAYEGSTINVFDEFRRKSRILAGSLASLWEVKSLLIPFKSPIAFQLWTRKILRWLGILFMVSIFLSNLFLVGVFYKITLLSQCIFYIMAILGFIVEIKGYPSLPIFNIPFYFCLSNLAQIFGVWVFLRKRNQPAWEKIKR